MSYRATVIEVMIASPSDVDDERNVVRAVLTDWNRLNSSQRSVVFLPVGWDTHSAPDLGGRPQSLINDRVLERSDLLVGIFGARVGSPTGKADSGTIEEIQEHHDSGKPVMLYFSNAPLPRNHDRDQVDKLEEFKLWAYERGLVGSFVTSDELRRRFSDDLQINLQNNPYLRSLIKDAEDGAPTYEAPAAHLLSEDAMRILRLAGSNQHGMVMVREFLGGTSISAGSEVIFDAGSPRELARWRQAVEDLESAGCIRDANGKGQVYRVTHAGYAALDSDEPEGKPYS